MLEKLEMNYQEKAERNGLTPGYETQMMEEPSLGLLTGRKLNMT